MPEDHFVVPPVYIGLIDTLFFLRDNKLLEAEVHKILAKTVRSGRVGGDSRAGKAEGGGKTL